ncbi:MAG: response regulator [Elusimicrobia bacterium]|nr:response regulator [Elusimicrobiota bacterium]
MATRIMVVDDDPLVGELSSALLRDAGYEVELVDDSIRALELIKAKPPAVAVLDILMPGLDGMTLCHRIKSDPGTKEVRVVIVSGKAFHADRKRALDYGAELFIEKPYDVDTFAKQVAALIAGQAPPPPAATEEAKLGTQEQAGAETKLTMTVWGCRSLSPFKGGEPSRYGRNTSCVSLETESDILIFDAGSGIVPLGREIVKNGRYKDLWLFLSHFHQDHFEGLAEFAPAYTPGYKLNISGANDPGQALQDRVQRIFETAPPDLGALQAELQLFEMMEETYEVLPGVQVSPYFANHPGTTLGFVIDLAGLRFSYSPDAEIYGEEGTALQDYDERLGRLIQGSDLLVHDGRYLDSDYQTRKNNGHSSYVNTVHLAARSGVKRLVLFHHDDAYTDAILDRIDADAQKIVADKGYKMQVVMAREALKIGI